MVVVVVVVDVVDVFVTRLIDDGKLGDITVATMATIKAEKKF